MERAGILLNDEEHVRWPLPELANWINDAVSAIIIAKPSASSESRIIPLARGTWQQVPQGGSFPRPHALLEIRRNVRDPADRASGGRIVTPVGMNALDAQAPNWHDPKHVSFRREARHYVFDEAVPLEFYVYPGNDGHGHVEVALSTMPAPLAASGAPDLLASYEGQIGLPDLYSVPVLDYVIFRTQSKDDDGAMPGRAMAAYQQFAAAVGIKVQVEGATSPNARRGTP